MERIWLCLTQHGPTANTSNVLENREWEVAAALLRRYCVLTQPLEKHLNFFGASLLGGEAGSELGNHTCFPGCRLKGITMAAWGVRSCKPTSLFCSAHVTHGWFGAGPAVGLIALSSLPQRIFSHLVFCLLSTDEGSARFCVSHAFSQQLHGFSLQCCLILVLDVSVAQLPGCINQLNGFILILNQSHNYAHLLQEHLT